MKEWQKPVLTVLGTEETKGGGGIEIGDNVWTNVDGKPMQYGTPS